MRKKIYYSNSEITSNLYTAGNEWMLSDNTEYIGLYHTYTTNEAYTEPTWNPDKSKLLIPYVIEPELKQQYKKLNDLKLINQSPTEYFVKITPADIKNKFITRYFLKKINDTKILEVDEQTFKMWQTNKIDNNLYVGVSIKWLITGTVSGVISNNNNQIISAKSTLQNIQDKLSDPLQFYADTSIVIPPDINGLDS